MTNPKLTDITLIVDASPSMQPQTRETIKGVNAFVDAQIAAAKEAKQNIRINLVTFSSFSQTPEGPYLNEVNYNPAYGNGTALYDAVGNTINALGVRLRGTDPEARPGKVLVVIVTDGEENASRLFNKEQITSLIKRQTSEWSWDFVFMGANQDAWQVGQGIGILGTKSMAFAPNAQGFQAAFASASSYANRTVGADSVAAYVGNSFTSADVTGQANAGLDVTKLAVPDALKTGT